MGRLDRENSRRYMNLEDNAGAVSGHSGAGEPGYEQE